MAKIDGGEAWSPSYHLYLIPHFLLFLNKSISHFLFFNVPSMPVSLSVPAFLLSSHHCAFLLPFPPLFPSLPSYWHHSPPCVVMCNVLKLAQSMADCCRYKLISYKSGCSDQLPHRGQIDIKTDMRRGWASECICVRQYVDTAEVELSDLPSLINTVMTDNIHFQSI